MHQAAGSRRATSHSVGDSGKSLSNCSTCRLDPVTDIQPRLYQQADSCLISSNISTDITNTATSVQQVSKTNTYM